MKTNSVQTTRSGLESLFQTQVQSAQQCADPLSALRALSTPPTGKGSPELEESFLASHFGEAPLLPRYRVGSVAGEWRMESTENTFRRGYFTGLTPVRNNFTLYKGDTLFMSLTPLELQSHQIPLNECSGNVVVAGLGMGMIVLNLLARYSCDAIIVLEQSEDLLSAFLSILEPMEKELWLKAMETGTLKVIQADCKGDLPLDQIHQHFEEWGTGRTGVDYLYADIWPVLGSKAAEIDTKHMCQQLQPKEVYYWGQELDLVTFEEAMSNTPPSIKTLRERAQASGIPFSFLNWDAAKLEGYRRAAIAARYNVIMR